MKTTLLLVLAIFATLRGYSQLPQIDLGRDQNGNERVIDIDCRGFEIINKMPEGSYQYKISVEEATVEVPSLSTSNGASAANGCDSIMANYIQAYNNLKGATAESLVAQFIKTLQAEKKNITQANMGCYNSLDMNADILIDATSEANGFDFKLKKGQIIKIVINRLNNGTNEIEKTWIVFFKTPPRVDFLTHFGFTFSPGLVKRSTKYFAKQGTDNHYTITEMNDNGDEFWDDLSLTANFIYPFWYEKNPNDALHFAWMAGFGINGDAKFTVFTGPSVLLSDFMSIGLGFGVSNQYKLNGQYKAGDVITENLNFDQLHSKGLVGDILLTLTFRLTKKQLQSETE